MARLILDRVTKRFGPGAPAVEEVSLRVEPGTFLALLGPSGCGKTTILRMIAGFEQPSAGTIRAGARLLAGPGTFVAPEERNMAMVFQSYALWPHMDVAANIGYPLKLRGLKHHDRAARVTDALRAVRMEAFASRAPEALSGGQRQRVALARCLVSDPQVVLLDEPLANLDRHLRTAMEQSFRDFHARTGATMVYVTHDQAEAMALADQIAVMAAGRLLQLGPPEEIYRRPASREVAGLIGHGSVLELPLPAGAPRELGPEPLSRALNGVLDAALDAALDGTLDGTLDGAVNGALDGALAAQTGPRAAVFIRPEDVALAPRADAAFVVTSCVFTGERYALKLRGPGGLRLGAYAPAPLAPGARTGCRLLRGWRV